MASQHVIEVRSKIDRPRMLTAGELRAAAGERIVYADGHRLGGGSRIEIRQHELKPRAQERPSANRAEVLDAHVVGAIVGRVRAFRLVVATDPLVVVGEPGQVVTKAERLIERQRVVHLTVYEQRV